MFATAYNLAAAFTKPIIISSIRQDGRCVSAVGSFVIVNDEGWILTAAHVFSEFQKLADGKNRLLDYMVQRQAIESDQVLARKLKEKRLRALGAADPAWVSGFFILVGRKRGDSDGCKGSRTGRPCASASATV